MARGPAHSLGARRHPVSGNTFCKFTYLKRLRGLPTGAQLVLRVLADYADGNGRKAHPGIPRLAADCCMGESTARRHLKWLEKNGYVVQESRGHNVGDVPLASVYSLTLPVLPLTGERKPTAQSEAPTAQSKQTYRSNQTDLPLTGEHLSNPVPDPFTSDPFTSDPGDDVCPFGNEPIRWIDDDPGWDNALTRGMEDGTDETPPQEFHSMAEWNRIEQAKAAAIAGPHPFQANTIGTEPNTFADAEYDDTEAFYAFAAERESA
jgi:Helix-turn-helix domain